MKKKKKKSLVMKFCTIVFSCVSVFLLIATLIILSYSFFINPADETASNTKPGMIQKMFLPPKKTKFLVIGLDKADSLTDSMFVGCFDRDTHKISVISIPRDTHIQMSKEMIKELRDNGRHPPLNGIMKMNAVHAYAGKDKGILYCERQVEELLGIKFDYYVEVSLDAFKKTVNSVGGIWMDIPKGGLHYNDPAQNLRIKVPEGHQLLNGDMAEGVVRFRATYKRGDLQRIEMQHAFMKEFFTQVLNKDTIKSNIGSFVKTLITDVKTNFGIDDLPKYLKYANKLQSDDIAFYTLPGVPKMIGGVSYFICDQAESAKLIDQIFYSDNLATPTASDDNKKPVE